MQWTTDMIGVARRRPATRLSEARAAEIAANALAASHPPGEFTLMLRDVTATDDGIVWVFDTATRGSGASVSASDADERLIEIRRRNAR